MLRRLVGIVIVVLAFASQSLGFEVGAIIRKIDVDNEWPSCSPTGETEPSRSLATPRSRTKTART